MEHNNTGPVNALLIGSRAWNKEFGNATKGGETSNADWDLIVSAERLSNLLHGKTFYHYRPQLEHGKLSVVSPTGEKVEFEILEKFESAKILKSLSKERRETVKMHNVSFRRYSHEPLVSRAWTIDLNVPSKEALLVLKASHIYFPVNWRKNFRKLITMTSSFYPNSFSKVIKDDPNSSLLKDLFQTRARETLHRIKSQVHLSVQRIHAPTVQQLQESCKGYYGGSDFLFNAILQTKEDPSDTITLPTTGVKLSKSAWLKYGQETEGRKKDEIVGKALIVYEQLVLLALHYYLPRQRDFGYMSKLKKEDQIEELLMLCVETFVTQQLVPVTRATEHHPEYKSYYPVGGDQVAADVYNIDLYETLPLASNADLAKSTFANPIVNWLLDHLSTEYDDIRVAFTSYIRNLSDRHKDLFTQKQFTVALPFEVIEMIKSSMPDDYVLLSKLCRVCKSWNRYFSEDYNWEPLCYQFDEETRQAAKKQIDARLAHHRGDWKAVFREMMEFMKKAHLVKECPHCRDFHERVGNYDKRNASSDEEYWGLCACPACDAGSWRDCPHYDEFFFE